MSKIDPASITWDEPAGIVWDDGPPAKKAPNAKPEVSAASRFAAGLVDPIQGGAQLLETQSAPFLRLLLKPSTS